jgi:hypothetical protein
MELQQIMEMLAKMDAKIDVNQAEVKALQEKPTKPGQKLTTR